MFGTMGSRGRPLASVIVALLLGATVAHADYPLTPAQQKCANGFLKASTKVVQLYGKLAVKCLARIDKGEVFAHPADCVMFDPKNAALLAKADAKVVATIAKSCSIPYPMTCVAPCEAEDDGGATTDIDDDAELGACLHCINMSIPWSAMVPVGLLQGLHGALWGNMPLTSATPTEKKCRAKVVKATDKLFAAKLALFIKCAKTEFLTTGAPPVSCIAGIPTNGKIVNSVTKLAAIVNAAPCTTALFGTDSECDGLAGTALADCADRIAECKFCRWAEGLIGGASGFDCDTFDDGAANTSCLSPSGAFLALAGD